MSGTTEPPLNYNHYAIIVSIKVIFAIILLSERSFMLFWLAVGQVPVRLKLELRQTWAMSMWLILRGEMPLVAKLYLGT
jgi:hypothetical protein